MDRLEVTKDILGHWLSQDKKKLGWWVDLVLLSDNQGVVHMNLTDLASRWGTSKPTVHRFVSRLCEKPICETIVKRQGDMITVCNSESCKGSKNEVRNDSETAQESPLISLSPTPLIPFNPKENYNTPTAPAYVRTREDEFVRRYRDEGMWMDVALILHLKSSAECQKLFEEFVVEYQHKGDSHSDYNDFKRHFIQWARIAIQKNPPEQRAENKPKVLSGKALLDSIK